MPIKSIAVLLVLSLCMFTGCAKKTWDREIHEVEQVTNRPEADRLYTKAYEMIGHAGDLESLLASMDVLRQVIAFAPNHREALAYLGNLHILLGTAYTENREEKTVHFQQAMKYCELSLYTNPQYQEAITGGRKPWEAAHTLQIEDAPAMLFWVIALQYEFKEGMTWPAKISNVGWLQHAIAFLDRIKVVDPLYGNGAVEFAYSICYLALPSFFGGDKSLGKSYLEQSIALGKDYLLPRWGKGTYYHQVTGDRGSSIKDLRWVANQNPEDFKDLYPWRMHFIADAKLQLELL